MPPDEEKRLLKYHKENHCQYNKFWVVDTALHHQILKALKDTYLYTFNKNFTGHYNIPTIFLISHLYGHSAQISSTYLVANEIRL